MRHAAGVLLGFAARLAVFATLLVALATGALELAVDNRPASTSHGPKLPRSVHDLALHSDKGYVVLQFPEQLAVGERGQATPLMAVPFSGGSPESLAGPTPDGRVLIGFGDGVVRSWAATGPDPGWRTVGRHDGPAQMIAVSSDGCLAAAAHAASELADPRSTVTVWDSPAGDVVASISVPSSIDGISFCSASERLITRAGDGTISVWQARGGDRVGTFCCGPPGRGSMACSPVGSLIAACVATGDDIHSVLVAVYDLSHGDRHWDTSIALRCDAAAFHQPRLAFSEDGQFLACGTADAVTLFNASDGQLLAEVDAGWHRISALKFAADGQSVVSAGQDGTVRWWSLPGLSELQRNEDLLPD